MNPTTSSRHFLYTPVSQVCSSSTSSAKGDLVEVRPLRIGPWPLKRSISDKSSDGRRPGLELLTYSINEPGLSKMLARVDEEAVLMEDIESKEVLTSTDVEKGDGSDDYVSPKDLEWATRFCNALSRIDNLWAVVGPVLSNLALIGAYFYYYDSYSSFSAKGRLPGMVMMLLFGFFTFGRHVLAIFVLRWTSMVKAGLTGSRDVSRKLALKEVRWMTKGLQRAGMVIGTMMVFCSIVLLGV